MSAQIEAQSDSIKKLLRRIGDASLLIKGDVFVDCNQAAIDLLGHPNKQSLLNAHHSQLSPTNQPDGRNSIEKGNEIIKESYKKRSTFFEWTHLKYDGTPILIDVLLTPVQINNEDMLHVIWRDLTEKKAAEAKIEKLAYEDSLTGLTNRRSFIQRLTQTLEIYKRTLYNGALLFIDLDHFKNVNDTLWHNAGDNLLKQVANRLEAAVRAGDTVSRFGGDEFVVMLAELDKNVIHAANKAELACEKLLLDLNKPYEIKGKEVSISASIGVSMFAEDSVASVLLQKSDIAMYQAKASGRNAIRFFDPEMQKAINERAATEQLIRDALSDKLFELHYQLQVNQYGDAVGVEALLRLNHPKQGFIPPMHYIPIAEETGLIVPVGFWVIEKACQQLKQWEGNPNTSGLTIAVNISPLEFNQEDFVINVLSAIKNSGANPMLLKLEITETMLVGDIEKVILIMGILKESGVQFSLDDFGTGYSSLQYLRKLPLDQLKIDQSFIRDLEHDEQDRSIVETIIVMGKALGLNVIAEGVENTHQQDMLCDYGCFNYQGYLFAKPMPATDIEKRLNC
ncbi:MAG: hypothetical protein A6F70_06430 [Cycloclasticus sp. symbiont of Bathymodiolus heckerae]|nr:MAG: hypothetical protein A6F70_06430 [Cycloclasticus sp. symbiont of Bathymodiolus heckerae]